MKLHNKLKITKGNREYVSHNNLLLPAIEFLSENKPYFSFLAIGENGDETAESQQWLNCFKKTYPLSTISYNIDPSKGELYITKKLVLTEDDQTPLKILELGVTADGESDNPKVANRFLANMGEPIYRDAGEEMSFEVTIYLTQDENSQAVFTAGENKLVKYLLGDYPNEYESHPPFLIARGYNTTPNSTIISRPNSGIFLTLASVEKNLDSLNGSYEMKIYADIGSGEVREFLLSMDGQIVLRSNTTELYGEETGIEKTLTADWDNMATLDVAGVKSIDKVMDLTTGEEITDYTTCVFGTSFTDGFRRIFQNMGYTKDTWRIVAKDALKIGFVHDNIMDVYDYSGETPVLMATEAGIDTTDAYIITIIKDQILIKWHNQESDTYGVRFYLYHDDMWHNELYKIGNVDDTLRQINKDKKWRDFDVTISSPDWGSDLVYMAVSELVIQAWKTELEIFGLTSNKNYFSNIMLTHNLTALLPSNRMAGGMFIFYNEKGDNIGLTSGVKGYERFSDDFGLDILKNYNTNGFPFGARNFVYAIDDNLKMLKAYSIDARVGKTVTFENAEKIYISRMLDYVVVKEGDFDFKVYYLDASLNLYEFMGGLPYMSTKIVDVEFVNSKIILFLENGQIISRQINLSKNAIVGVEKDHEIKVTYSADNSPGLSGGNVRAIVKIKTSV